MDKATLMMALLIASTTLTGLTVVFMGQVAQAARQEAGRARRADIDALRTLLATIILSVAVILSTIIWFSSGSHAYELAAYSCFTAQIIWFSTVFIIFWCQKIRQH